MDKMRIGWVGTGIMGAPMVLNLLRAGHEVTVFNRTRAKADPLLEAGARWADSPAEAAKDAEVVATMVGDSPDVEAVFLAADGVCAGPRPGALAIDMSSVSPRTAKRVAAAVDRVGGSFLDAPVSGGKTGAEAGTLAIMVGGEAADVERARPVFDAVGQTVVHCGPVGTGQLTKLCNQILCGLNLLGVCEAFVFAQRTGLEVSKMLAITSKGAGGSWALENLGTRMAAGDFDPMFMIDLQNKDLGIALEMAQDHVVPLPGTSLVHQLLAAGQAAGEGRLGTQAMVKTLQRLAGIG
ncbi:MAG TPA: NAD(P)-dependent oxidoreductase [Phycisphaerae bacterium]|nr:NAD(P)-dependent oxidoreductase [Phycisphaerae bacterium]